MKKRVLAPFSAILEARPADKNVSRFNPWQHAQGTSSTLVAKVAALEIAAVTSGDVISETGNWKFYFAFIPPSTAVLEPIT